MSVILYLLAVMAFLLAAQSVVLLAFREPLQWHYGARSRHPEALRLTLKAILQITLIGSLLVFPYLTGSTPGAYYGPLFPWRKAHYFLYGEGIALALLGVIYAVEWKAGWLYWQPRFPPKKALVKSLRSALSSITVAAVEEPFFRGIIMRSFLAAAMAPLAAILLSAVLFSAAHFLRRVSTYWPFVGLAVLGLWLGVAYYKTGNLWLSMGLHSGGILSIGVHRCFLNYRGPVRWIGTQTYPIAGLTAMGIMLVGTVITWFVF
jgi:membrane protease YdiL (CAAX protease family)